METEMPISNGRRLMFKEGVKSWERFRSDLKAITKNGVQDEWVPLYQRCEDLLDRTYQDSRHKREQLNKTRNSRNGLNLESHVNRLIDFVNNVLEDLHLYEQGEHNELWQCQNSKHDIEERLKREQEENGKHRSRISELLKDKEGNEHLITAIKKTMAFDKKEFDDALKESKKKENANVYSKNWHFTIAFLLLTETNYILKLHVPFFDWVIFGLVEVGAVFMLYYFHKKKNDFEASILKVWGVVIGVIITYIKARYF